MTEQRDAVGGVAGRGFVLALLMISFARCSQCR